MPAPRPPLPSLLSAARREEEDEQGQNCPICRTSPSGCPESSSQTGNTDARDKGLQPHEHGPRRGPFPQGVLGSRFIPTLHSAASARGSGFRVGSGSARMRHKEAPVPAAERRRGLGREGEPRQPPVTGRRQQAGPGRPAAGHPAKLRDGRESEALAGASLAPHEQPPPGTAAPRAAAPAPTGGLRYASRRTAPSRLPVPSCPQPAPSRAPPLPPAPFP